MKIRTQISLGYFSLALILVAVAGYFLLDVAWLNRINQSLTNVDSQARKIEIQEIELLNDLFDYDLKYLATQDPDYLRGMEKVEKQYEGDFESLTRLLSTSSELQIAEKIRSTYEQYKRTFRERADAEGKTAEMQISLDNRKYDLMQSLRQLNRGLEQETYAVMQGHLLESENARRQAGKIAILSGIFAITFAVLLSILLARRISSPLGILIEGTRKIAAGRFGTFIPLTRPDEFGELAQAFNFMARQLGELDELKKGFVSHVSHELKSPLASIRETQDLLSSETLGALNDRQKRLLCIGREKAEVLSRRISDLLDMSRMEAGVMEYQLEPAEMCSLLRSTVESTSPMLLEKNLKIVSEFNGTPIEATVDSQRLTQVVENLLTNAIKFSRENSTIRIRCQRVEGRDLMSVFEMWDGSRRCNSRGNYIKVTVEDEGAGIAAEETKRIFEKFYQARQGNQFARTGTGLGLAICRNIVHAHNGIIWVESRLKQGSQFHFAIPASLPKGPRKSRQAV